MNLEVLPVGDKIGSDVTTSYTGSEDQPITITLDLAARDNADSLVPSQSNASENAPEIVRELSLMYQIPVHLMPCWWQCRGNN